MGFMSGTSLDAVDAALIETDGEQVSAFGPAIERKFSDQERAILAAATEAARAWNWQGSPPGAIFKKACLILTIAHAEAAETLLAGWQGPRPILAGVHGQTVLHRAPAGQVQGKTLQLIDAPAIQGALGLPLVYDFRSQDVAAGGQGAPLAPAYHAALLARLGDGICAALNLGGVANITVRLRDGSLIAFDTGPANGPIDEWVAAHGAGTHDAGGALALAGQVDEARISDALAHDWFREPAPKSLDRYDFSAKMAEGLSLEDGAATLTAFSARCVGAAMAQLAEPPERILACGGGRHNPALMGFLQEALPCELISADNVGWRGDSIEAEAFAYLAARSVRGLPISWPMTTGVPTPMSGGAVLGV